MRNKLRDNYCLQLEKKVKIDLGYPYHFHDNPHNSLKQGCFFVQARNLVRQKTLSIIKANNKNGCRY